ncbi:hypothetical protein FJ364_02780 [Candidatus Dependentiae bacterium]|nr:hypothetical protein [Candidatus Dependentiae bacterium]
MEYPKINSLFKRNVSDNSLIISDYACPEFGLLKAWRVEEKIDGTNIRIVYDPLACTPEAKLSILGRSKDSAMPAQLHEWLKNHFTLDRIEQVLAGAKSKCIFYGEGYGGYIQSAGPYYQKSVGFMLFDVLIGHWWLTREDVAKKAAELGVPFPPDLGIMTEKEIVALVQSKPLSKCTITSYGMEGIIARPEPLLLFRNGRPVVWKLKVKDFE